MAKVLGVTGCMTVGGTNFEIDSVNWTLSEEDIEYVAMCQTAGSVFATQVPGGVVRLEGSFEGALDTTKYGSGTYPLPFQSALAAVVITVVSGVTISFDAKINSMAVTASSAGLQRFTCNFKSSGTITYAAA